MEGSTCVVRLALSTDFPSIWELISDHSVARSIGKEGYYNYSF